MKRVVEEADTESQVWRVVNKKRRKWKKVNREIGLEE